MRKTLVLVRHDRAGIPHLLDTPCTIEHIFCPHPFELGIRERNRMGYKPLLIPEPHSTEIGLRPADLAQGGPIYGFIHIAFAIYQNHMDIIF
jgi:hypothetical protein